jgi:hypothetical protein
LTEKAEVTSSILDEYFRAVDALFVEQGLKAERIESDKEGFLGLQLFGSGANTWVIHVDCDANSLMLPSLLLGGTSRLLAHVSYSGMVCVNDGQGLSLDSDRRTDIVAHTVLAGYELLERSVIDEANGQAEFFNELEGYWATLPNVCTGRATFEVDAKDRLLTAHLDHKAVPSVWWLTEYRNPVPSDFRPNKAINQRGLYVHLDRVPSPPCAPDKLTEAFVEAIRTHFTPVQEELWQSLVGSSKNGPKHVVLIVSMPRAAGGTSAIGVSFRVKDGFVDAGVPPVPISLRRHTASYMRERGGASLNMLHKHVVVVGCGSIGSQVADILASSGIGRLTLVDFDTFSEENVFRHFLPVYWVDVRKTRAMAFVLESTYPGLSAMSVPHTAEQWLTKTNLEDVDGIVMAIGQPTVERSLSRIFRANALHLPVVYTWLEALDLGGHSVLAWTKGEGCLDCIFRDDEGLASLYSRTAFLAPNQVVTRNLTGCAGNFVPYGALQARRTALLAAEHLLAALDGNQPAASYRNWVGEGKVARQQGLHATPWRDIARRLSDEEATKRVFGLPCIRCMGST